MNPVDVISDMIAILLICIMYPVLVILARAFLYTGQFKFYAKKKLGKIDDEEFEEKKEIVAEFWSNLYEIENDISNIVKGIVAKYR